MMRICAPSGPFSTPEARHNQTDLLPERPGLFQSLDRAQQPANPGLPQRLSQGPLGRPALSGSALGPCRFRLYRHNRCRSLLSTCEGLLQGLKFTGQRVDLTG